MDDSPQNAGVDLSFLEGVALTELHTHVGFSVSPPMLWEMAHDQGIVLPTKSYWEFEKMVTIHETKAYEEYLKMYDWTEQIQSSPESLFHAMQHSISGAYRKNNITTIELRYNPMLRNRSGERDLDHIIVFSLQGMERAMLKYPVQAGVILMMDRRFPVETNAVIVKKAIKYRDRGVIGVDLGGPVDVNDYSRNFKPHQIRHLIEEAKGHGLGITIHTGEATNLQEMWEVVEELKPHRIGHGIVCAQDPALMQRLNEEKMVLETCPSSNLNTRILSGYQEMRALYRTLQEHEVAFTINTDGPEMQRTSLREEFALLLKHGVLDRQALLQSNEVAAKSTFIHKREHH